MGSKSEKTLKEKEKLKYIDTLDKLSRERYEEKIKLIDGKDPYEISTNSKEWSADVQKFPDISYPDIFNYLVNKLSAYTVEDLKAYKSLESYNYFICGWVKDVRVLEVEQRCLLTSRVQHSQRMSATPLQPWLIADKNGTILAAHCNCMAGLGEVCSHVGAMLFAVDAAVRVRNSKTVTQEKAYWLLPTGLQKVEYKPVRDIDFQSAKSKKRTLDQKIDNQGVATPKPRTKNPITTIIPEPTAAELNTFFRQLHNSGTKPAILSLMPEYSDNYVPSSMSNKYPIVLNELSDEKCFDMDKCELVDHCRSVSHDLSVTPEQATNVENVTKLQTGCKEWYRFRAGRVTASRLKAVCKTSVDKPAQSLIKNICYPQSNKFATVATKWGCDHEKIARERYENDMKDIHDGFEISDCGLVIHPDFPYLGASPDGIMKCECCGNGCIEVKCPYCSRNQNLCDTLGAKSCLESVDGKLQLKRTHEYYYQVQCQIFLCDMDFCDFVVWTEKDLHCERILPDPEFWSEISKKAKEFFTKVILLELVGKFFSRPSKPTATAPVSNESNSVHSAVASASGLSCEHLDNASSSAGENVQNKIVAVKIDSKVSSVKKPEVLSPKKSTSNNIGDDNYADLICVCQTNYDPDYDSVIGCDNENCPYVWLHYKCVQLKRVPKGKWYCPTCRQLPEFKKKSKSKKC